MARYKFYIVLYCIVLNDKPTSLVNLLTYLFDNERVLLGSRLPLGVSGLV